MLGELYKENPTAVTKQQLNKWIDEKIIIYLEKFSWLIDLNGIITSSGVISYNIMILEHINSNHHLE